MKFSYRWLKELSGTEKTPEELAAFLTMRAFEVEEVTPVGFAVPEVFVGQVVSLERHPNADRLRIARVDIGDRLPTTGEHGGHIDQHLPAVMPRHETPTRQGAGELAGQAHLLGQQTHRGTAGVSDHADTITGDGQARGPRCTLHVPSAFPCRVFVTSQSQVSRYRTGTLVHPGGVSPTHP